MITVSDIHVSGWYSNETEEANTACRSPEGIQPMMDVEDRKLGIGNWELGREGEGANVPCVHTHTEDEVLRAQVGEFGIWLRGVPLYESVSIEGLWVGVELF